MRVCRYCHKENLEWQRDEEKAMEMIAKARFIRRATMAVTAAAVVLIAVCAVGLVLN